MKISFILLKLVLPTVVACIGLYGGLDPQLSFALMVVAYLIAGGDVLYHACTNLFGGSLFDENFLMSIATVGAFIIGEPFEAIVVMLFYQIGECFQNYAVGKSRKSISSLVEILPEFAIVLRQGQEIQVSPQEVQVGEQIIVRVGDKIPLDGVIISGRSSLDTSALTGESLPLDVCEGGSALSGCINLSGVLTLEVIHCYADSTVAKILDLVENAGVKKSKSEKFITKFARYYTPVVVVLAAILAITPPLFFGGDWHDWVYRGISFLVVSCPCALVISIPLGFFGGIGGAARHGILVKGGVYLESLAKAEAVVFDKTGTLTKGEFAISSLHPNGITNDDLLLAAATAEQYSNHPIAISITKSVRDLLPSLDNAEELAGLGVVVTCSGDTLHAGNARLMEQIGLTVSDGGEIGSVVHVAKNNLYLGYLVVADQLKSDSAMAISNLNELGISNISMLTGDRVETAQSIGEKLGIPKIHAQLLPEDKLNQLELELASTSGKLVYVGDGINDAPVLARADIGIAMGGMGSQAAIEAADIVIMNDAPTKIVTAMKISKKTMTIVRQNIALCFIVKGCVLLLATGGMSSLLEAIFADVGVAVLAILNAMRAMHYKENDKKAVTD